MSTPAPNGIAATDFHSRDRILERALSLFANEGYGAVTMRAIARAAGLTIGTLYHYFPSKRALYLAVLERAYGRAARHWAQEILHSPDDPYQRLAAYVREYCAFVAANHDFVRLVKREQLQGDAEQMELQAASLFANQFQATVDLCAELAPHLDATLLAHSVLALVLHHYEARALRPLFPGHRPEHEDPARVADHVLGVLLHGIRPTDT
ncbi:MAG: hypothetical protein Kow0073_14790 [Immundisolibacter sp.]